MPLPAIGDQALLKQLAIVVTAGWQLHQQPRAVDEVRELLELVPSRGRASAFRQRAHDFLTLLDQALISSAWEPAEAPLLTEDQVTGLRILFGTHASYRMATASVRRNSAAEYLGEPRRGSKVVQGDSLYRRRQGELLQLALDCLRYRYGQDPPGTPHLTEVESATILVNFDQLNRIDNVHYRYEIRARKSITDKLFARAELPAAANPNVDVTAYGDLVLHNVRQWIPGHLSISLKPPHALKIGERLEYAIRLHYSYSDLLPACSDGYLMHWEHNDGYRLIIKCNFPAQPEACWSFDQSLLYYPGAANRHREIYAAKGTAWYETSATRSRMAHGIAWQWTRVPGTV